MKNLVRGIAFGGWLTLAFAPAATAATVPVRVTIQSLAPANGTFLTPVWVGFHDGTFDLYDVGAPASTALERIAEDGDNSVVTTDFAASGAGVEQGTIMGPGGPIGPGQTATMTFFLDSLASTSRFFSYASMIIPSNDAFIANGNPLAIPVFDPAGKFVAGSFIVLGSMVLDSGAEVNDEIPMNTAFFGQVTPDTGVAENGVVMVHPGFLPLGSGGILDAAMFANADFKAPGYQITQITLQVVPEPTTFAIVAAGVLLLYRLRRSR